MEKKPPRQHRHSFSNSAITTTTKHHPPPGAAVWDCGSALYDSFELRSFEKQLYSAINSRTLSMPHLPDRRVAPAPAPTPSNTAPHHPEKKKSSDPVTEGKKRGSSRISRSVQRFFKSVFANATTSLSGNDQSKNKKRSSRRGGGVYFVYDKTGALCTIPEGTESDNFGPDVNSLAKRSASERFTAATAVGISCA